MKMISAPRNEANYSTARRLVHDQSLRVDAIRPCGNCNEPATVLVAGLYPRCQPCANHLVNLWNTMRAAINEQT